MINFDKHTVRFGSGDIDIDVIETNAGTPVLALSNKGEKMGKDSLFIGFDNGESIDGLIAILRNIRKTYYVQPKNSLSTTQAFKIYTDIADG